MEHAATGGHGLMGTEPQTPDPEPKRERSRPEQPPIYTKTGDDGSTGRLFGGRVSKADPVIECCGAIDEAVAAFGVARANLAGAGATGRELAEVVLELQRGLFVAAADVAANPGARERLTDGVSRVTGEMVAALERRIDTLLEAHPLRPAFIVPGDSLPSATLDLARTLVRRAERALIAGAQAGMPASPELVAFVNRASDLAYVLARRSADDDEPLSHT